MFGVGEIGLAVRDGVAVISLLAPERRNALTVAMARELVDAAAAVPLSSVRQPRELLGRTAAELLAEEVAGDGTTHEHRHAVFQPDLIVRRSSER